MNETQSTADGWLYFSYYDSLDRSVIRSNLSYIDKMCLNTQYLQFQDPLERSFYVMDSYSIQIKMNSAQTRQLISYNIGTHNPADSGFSFTRSMSSSAAR